MNNGNRSLFSTNYLLIETMMKNINSENHNEREPRTGVSENQGDAGVRTNVSENQNFTKPVISPVKETSENVQTIEYVDFEGKRVVKNYEKKL
jgi:hypothetical protein